MTELKHGEFQVFGAAAKFLIVFGVQNAILSGTDRQWGWLHGIVLGETVGMRSID